jgi:hypothetical protein
MPKIENIFSKIYELKISFWTKIRLFFVKPKIGWDPAIPGYYVKYKELDGIIYMLKERGIF